MPETARHLARRRGQSKPDSALTSRSLLSFLVALLLACGDGEATVPTAPTQQPAPAPVPTSMVITPPSATLAALAQTVQLTATVQDQDGGTMTGVAVNWASSDGGVAAVDAEGLVTAVRNGATSVTATVRGGGPSASAAVTVSQQATEMRLSPVPEVFRAFGETLQLTAEVLDANGNAVVDAAVEWSSGDPSVVAVDSGGLVTAVGNGKASVSAASRSTRADAEFVVEQEPATMSVSPAADTLSPLADTLQLRAEALDANGHLVGTARFTWSSSDETVAAVSASGFVTTKGPGSVEITAAARGADLTATAMLLVVLRERDILERFYVAANGSNWKNNENWLTDAPLGSWYGVRTNSRSGSVVQLDLSDNGLSGSIPASLGYLVELGNLDLRDNQLTGSLPPELGNLSKLVYLDLINNSLTGSIPPELGRLTGLLNLWLDQNALSGAIPPDLGDLGSLRQLRLGYNNLTGSIPPELGKLSSLISLYLPGNGLTGAIPPELGDLVNLSGINLRKNALSGPIPERIGNLPRLVSLTVSENRLSGSIPKALGNLTHLRSIYANENTFSGSIPPELGTHLPV